MPGAFRAGNVRYYVANFAIAQGLDARTVRAGSVSRRVEVGLVAEGAACKGSVGEPLPQLLVHLENPHVGAEQCDTDMNVLQNGEQLLARFRERPLHLPSPRDLVLKFGIRGSEIGRPFANLLGQLPRASLVRGRSSR